MILLQPKRLVVRDLEEIDDVITNANVDLLPQIEMMRIKGVVEIEDPGLDGPEICGPEISGPGICGFGARPSFRRPDSLLPSLSTRKSGRCRIIEKESKNGNHAAPRAIDARRLA
jgi:hypothetical protein